MKIERFMIYCLLIVFHVGCHFEPGLTSGGSTTLRAHRGSIYCLSFSPSGDLLASGGGDGLVRLWDAPSLKERSYLPKLDDQVYAVRIAPDGKTLAWGGLSGKLGLWDLPSGRELAVIAAHSGPIMSLAFSPDSKRLVAGGGRRDPAVRCWDLTDLQSRIVIDLRGIAESADWLAFTPDGRGLATPDRDNGIRIWDASHWEKGVRLEGLPGRPSCIAISPDGTLVASAGQEFASAARPLVRLWETATGVPKKEINLPGGFVKCLAFSPDGRMLATVGSTGDTTQSPGEVRLWEVSTGRQLARHEGTSGPIVSVAFSPNGQTLVTGSSSGWLERWISPEKGKEKRLP